MAAHSGNSSKSYFHNLNKLNINDNFYLYSNNKKYTFSVTYKYEIEKNGKLEYIEDGRTLAYLTTCSENNSNKQLVVIGLLNN